jgi:protein-tyrosine phosphatase
VIDLHTHLLPGLDDGPPDAAAALALARAAVGAGTRTAAATPHVDRTFRLAPAGFAAARAALAGALAEAGIPLALAQGGEVAPDRLPELGDDDLRAVTLGGGSCVLLECPFRPEPRMEALVADLQARGFTVLLAHPERSPLFQQDLGRLGALVDAGALAQVTAGSFAGDFGGPPRHAAEQMLEAGLVHVLASDGHDPVQRPPEIRRAVPALEARYGAVEEQVAWMADALPAALLADAEVPARPPLPRPLGRLRRLRRA